MWGERYERKKEKKKTNKKRVNDIYKTNPIKIPIKRKSLRINKQN